MSDDEKPVPLRLTPAPRRGQPEPFNRRPAVASLGEAPDWRGHPLGRKGGERMITYRPPAPAGEVTLPYAEHEPDPEESVQDVHLDLMCKGCMALLPLLGRARLAGDQTRVREIKGLARRHPDH